MKKFLKPALAMMTLAMLGACNDDVIVDDNTGLVAEKSEVRYLRVSICNPGNDSGTKAPGDGTTDYVAGSEAENQIKTLDFYFYDRNKQYVTHSNLLSKNNPNADTPVTNFDDPTLDLDGTPGNNVEAVYHCNVPVQLVQGERLPAYVLCIINANNPNGYDGMSMEQAQKELVYGIYDQYSSGDATLPKYFGMNNSVYYGTDEVTGAENQLIMATPFDALLLKTSAELETADAAKEARVKVYVERYAAKVKLNVANNADIKVLDAGNTQNTVKVTFTPEKWALNAYEKAFYLIKGYREQDDPSVFDKFENLNNRLFAGWNRADHHRSFWARTPAYFDNEYPIVADDILDPLAEKGVTYDPIFTGPNANIDGYPYTVYYSSYNSINSAKGEGKAVGESLYTMETTLKENRMNGKDMPGLYLPINSIPSVVLTGAYTVNVNGTDYNKTFYTYSDNNGLPYVLAANPGDLGPVPTIKETLVEQQNIVLLRRENGQCTPLQPTDLVAGTENLFIVEHPNKTVRNDGSMKVTGDLVTLQLDELGSHELYFYDANASTPENYYTRITDANKDQVNRLLYQNIGGAHMYNEGKAFFTAPIQHWGWQRANNDNKNKTIDQWDWSLMKAGDFGIVRNHVYNINIGGIAGWGTGIRDFNDPLLPPADKIGYNIHFDIYIQKWAVLPTQEWNW